LVPDAWSSEGRRGVLHLQQQYTVKHIKIMNTSSAAATAPTTTAAVILSRYNFFPCAASGSPPDGENCTEDTSPYGSYDPVREMFLFCSLIWMDVICEAGHEDAGAGGKNSTVTST